MPIDMFDKITEQNSNYDGLEKMSVAEILQNMNKEDQSVPLAVEKVLPQIEALVEQIVLKMKEGGRLFYVGAGTSGRLGILDASECPPTFGVDHNTVIGIIAGGDVAIRKAVENAEDDGQQCWKDLQKHFINDKDVLVGIAASGTTPYVIGGIKEAKKNGLVTGGITCNPGSPLDTEAEFSIPCKVGPEFVTGSSRLKAGTAQKLILNMVSTSVMIQLGKVEGNKMVDMKLSNTKLVDRAERMVMESTGCNLETAKSLLEKFGSVRGAIDNLKQP
jgi:N-acetylmuramic acid 6-phosphate etherase